MRRERYETTVHGRVEEFRSAVTIRERYKWSPEHWSRSFGCGQWGSAACHWPIRRASQSAQHGPSPVASRGSCQSFSRCSASPELPSASPSAFWPRHLGNRSHPTTLGLPIIMFQLKDHPEYNIKETFQVKVYCQTMKTARKEKKKLKPQNESSPKQTDTRARASLTFKSMFRRNQKKRNR